MNKQVTISTYEGDVTYELASFGSRFAARFLDSLIIVIPSSIVPIIAPWLYWALQQGGNAQATVGQKTMGIKVISTDGNPVTFGQASGRFFGNFLNVMTMFIGYFMYFFTEKNQCLHDMISGCLVVKADAVRIDDDLARHLVD